MIGKLHLSPPRTCYTKGDPSQEPRVVSIRNVFKYSLECRKVEFDRRWNLLDDSSLCHAPCTVATFRLAMWQIVPKMLRQGSGKARLVSDELKHLVGSV